MTSLERLNALYLLHALALNPHGWEHCAAMSPPRSHRALATRQMVADVTMNAAKVAFESKYFEAHPGVDMVAFFAGHDRLHAQLDMPFTMRGEIAVAKAQFNWLAEQDEEAARLHAVFVRRQGHLWRTGW